MNKNSLATLARLLDDTVVPLCVVDDQRRIAYCNAACAKLLAIPAAELVGRQCHYHAVALPDAVQTAANAICPPPDVYFGRRCAANLVLATGLESVEHKAEFIPLADDQDQVAAVLIVVDAVSQPLATDQVQDASAAARDWLARFQATQPGLDQMIALVGDVPPVIQAREQVRLAATTTVDVLIEGPAGSDRRRIARAIARHAEGGERPFTALSCVDLTESLLESTLEWALRQARSSQRPTLLLEEVDQLSPPLQIHLALALSKMPTVPRLLSTARQNVAEMVRQGAFRQDLACRLGTLLIHMPALVDRLDDLPLLAQALVEQANAAGDKQLAGVENEALEQLLIYPWPGDIEELRAVVNDAHAQAEGPRITADDLPGIFRHAAEAQARPPVEEERIVLDEYLARIELELIERALRQARGNKTKAAALLGMNRPRLYRRLVQLGLVTEFRPHDEPADQ